MIRYLCWVVGCHLIVFSMWAEGVIPGASLWTAIAIGTGISLTGEAVSPVSARKEMS